MAGAGFKTFNTGDVLTASDVNTYLMQQTVMVFASAAARTTALGANVAEGMLSYLKDTDVVEVYNGSAWVSSDDPNAIQNTIVDAKGDLISATANDTPARLASSGTNGDVLTVDTSTATGLKWAAPSTGATSLGFTAGKNKIINGDFNINQRAFTSTTTSGTYGFDRWILVSSGGTATYSSQAFTAGTAPVTGYEGKNFARLVTASQTGNTDFASIVQRIESVRSFANQTITISFWAKASTGTPKVDVTLAQDFGTGGSPSSNVITSLGNVTLTTSWARYSVTGAVPSISGKTLGTTTDGFLQVYLFTSLGSSYTSYGSIGLQNTTIDFWGVQAEAGSSITSFQTATGTLAGELAACQRYYQKSYENSTTIGASTQLGATYINIGAANTGNKILSTTLPVRMRTAPTVTAYDLVGASGKVYSGGNGVAATQYNISDGTIVIGQQAGVSAQDLIYHWTASAEL